MPKKEVDARGSKYATRVKSSLSDKKMAHFPELQGLPRRLQLVSDFRLSSR